MANFAIKAPDGTIEGIVVALQASDVAVPDGRSILPVGPNAEIGGTHDGNVFIRKPLPPPTPPPPESLERRAIRALAVVIDAGTRGAVAAVETELGRV